MQFLRYLILSLAIIPVACYTSTFFEKPRRHFLSSSISFIGGTTVFTPPCRATATQQLIKVTPLAHTFVVSKSSTTVKPIRENDSTRILTNARVVLLFLGSATQQRQQQEEGSRTTSVTEEIVALTVKRKREKGPGVTPGDVKQVGGEISSSFDSVRGLMASNAIGDGDCLLVGPLVSAGAREDEKIVKKYANELGLEIGAEKSGGVVGVLLNGPRAPNTLDIEGEAYSLLWYSV
mmetsp:Transcript_44449/g.53774  ORF Transcript_44449/g.53774 Transcript_44449/m.53774 type:complete len:235 (+) Transcript_44449:121-825(+)